VHFQEWCKPQAAREHCSLFIVPIIWHNLWHNRWIILVQKDETFNQQLACLEQAAAHALLAVTHSSDRIASRWQLGSGDHDASKQ
jgi:hypothetical protein